MRGVKIKHLFLIFLYLSSGHLFAQIVSLESLLNQQLTQFPILTAYSKALKDNPLALDQLNGMLKDPNFSKWRVGDEVKLSPLEQRIKATLIGTLIQDLKTECNKRLEGLDDPKAREKAIHQLITDAGEGLFETTIDQFTAKLSFGVSRAALLKLFKKKVLTKGTYDELGLFLKITNTETGELHIISSREDLKHPIVTKYLDRQFFRNSSRTDFKNSLQWALRAFYFKGKPEILFSSLSDLNLASDTQELFLISPLKLLRPRLYSKEFFTALNSIANSVKSIPTLGDLALAGLDTTVFRNAAKAANGNPQVVMFTTIVTFAYGAFVRTLDNLRIEETKSFYKNSKAYWAGRALILHGLFISFMAYFLEYGVDATLIEADLDTAFGHIANPLFDAFIKVFFFQEARSYLGNLFQSTGRYDGTLFSQNSFFETLGVKKITLIRALPRFALALPMVAASLEQGFGPGKATLFSSVIYMPILTLIVYETSLKNSPQTSDVHAYALKMWEKLDEILSALSLPVTPHPIMSQDIYYLFREALPRPNIKKTFKSFMDCLAVAQKSLVSGVTSVL